MEKDMKDYFMTEESNRWIWKGGKPVSIDSEDMKKKKAKRIIQVTPT